MCLNKFLAFVVMLFFLPTFAAEETEKKPPGKSDAAKIDATKNYSGKQNEEWLIVQNQLTTFKTRVENQKKLVEHLIIEKETVKGTEQTAVIEELKKAHLELIRLIGQYNETSTTFETKFPEKGGSFGRVYKRIDPASIDSLENKMTLEGRLQKLDRVIKNKYSKSPNKDDDKSNALKKNKKKLIQTDTGPQIKPAETQVTDQIILQK